MTSKISRALLLGVAFCLNAVLLHAGERPAAKDLLLSAHEISSLSKLMSYKLDAAFVVNPGRPSEKKGHLTIYREQDRWRSELIIEGYREVRLILGSNQYVSRSGPFFSGSLSMLARLDQAWDKLSDFDGKETSRVSQKKFKGRSVECFDVKLANKQQLCFDSEQKVLAQINYDHGPMLQFSDYSSFEQTAFPRTIAIVLNTQDNREGPSVREIRVSDIQILKAQFAEGAFDVPEHSREFETCPNQVYPKKLSEPSMFGNVPMRMGSWTTISIYGIVGKDGVVQDVTVAVNPPDARAVAAAELWARQIKYSPAICGSKSVAAEMNIEIQTLLPIN